VQAPSVYYQPITTQPIPPDDDSIDVGFAFVKPNPDDGFAITDFEAINTQASSSSSVDGSATQTKSSPQERPLTFQVQPPSAYYQPLTTQPITPGDDSIDFGVAFDNTNSVDGIAITDVEAVNTQASSSSTSRRECQ
jgi:hypothetical protein